jgi:hypothetical protein
LRSCINVNQFVSLDDARAKIEAWQQDDNHHQPHSSLGNLTPSEYAMQRQSNRTSDARDFQFRTVCEWGNVTYWKVLLPNGSVIG